MEKTDRDRKIFRHIALLSPITLGVVPWAWLVALCLTTVALLLLSACTVPPPTGPIPTRRRPTETPTPTPALTPTYTSTPTETPSPTPFPTPAPCVYYDVELDEIRDQYPYRWCVNSHPIFDLVLRNSGDCSWPEETRLMLVSTNDLDWPESWLVGTIGIDKGITVTVELTAPSIAQTLVITWQLEGPQGRFGSEITHALRVVWCPTSTPTWTPTATPTPTTPPPPPINIPNPSPTCDPIRDPGCRG